MQHAKEEEKDVDCGQVVLVANLAQEDGEEHQASVSAKTLDHRRYSALKVRAHAQLRKWRLEHREPLAARVDAVIAF
jgi:hypothetical protein